jgi:hypothetical protein
MAQKISLIDDLDGSEANETVTYSLDGKEYEIDLSEENAAKFREALQPYIDKSRPVERQASGQTPDKSTTRRWWGKRTRPPATDQDTD